MPGKVEALGILLLLLPGFTCAFLVQHIAVRAKQSELDKVVEALLLSFFLYLATLPFFKYSLPVSWEVASQNSGQYVIHLHWLHLCALGVAALFLALLYGANINHDWLLSVLRKANVTERTTRTSIWNDAFQDIKNTYVMVGLSDGRTVLGFVRYYSDESEDASVFLEDAAWLDEKGQESPIEGPGILITKNAGITFVSFINPKVEPSNGSSDNSAC